MPTLLTIIDYAIMGFTLTLSQWVSSLELISVLGLVIVIMQVLLRTVGLKYFPVSKADMDRACGRGCFNES